MAEDDYQFDDVEVDSSAEPGSTSEGMASESSTAQASVAPGTGSRGGSGGYADELFSKKIQTKFRTFYIDLKESSNGKFIKISEKSHGRKSTIMMDGEDVAEFIEALKEVQEKL